MKVVVIWNNSGGEIDRSIPVEEGAEAAEALENMLSGAGELHAGDTITVISSEE